MAYMSQEGYDKLIAELHRLEAIERPKASAAIAEAREKGDLCLHIGYFEAFGLDDILDIISCCLYVDYWHREQLLSLYYDKQKHRLLTYRRCLSFVWITTQRKCSPK